MLNQVAGNKGGKHKWAIKEEQEQKGREAESFTSSCDDQVLL